MTIMQLTHYVNRSKILTSSSEDQGAYLDAGCQEFHSLWSDKYILYQSLLIKREYQPLLLWEVVLTEIRSALTVVLVTMEMGKLLRSDASTLSLPVSCGGAGSAQWLPFDTEIQTLIMSSLHECHNIENYLFMLLVPLPFATICPFTWFWPPPQPPPSKQ